jgi:hypothetical protein
MRQTLGCCARDASGHAAAVPPIDFMNSRRFMEALPEAQDHAEPIHRTTSAHGGVDIGPGYQATSGF